MKKQNLNFISKNGSNKELDLSKLANNEKLTSAIKKFFESPARDTEKAFIKEILNANYLIPVKFEGHVKDGIMQEGSQISFVYIKDVNDKKFSPIFTSYDELKKWNKEHEQMVVMPYEQAIETLLDAGFDLEGISINPFSENIILNDEKINYIKNYDFDK